MRKLEFLTAFILGLTCSASFGQIKHTAIPIGNALDKALAKESITGEGARPFHIRVKVSEPENPQSPYQGSFEEWWNSPNQWRREVTDKDGMRQTIVVAAGMKTEKDEGDYFPVWLRNFVRAVFDPIPDAAQWTGDGLMIEQTTFPGGARTDACARREGKIGSAGRDSKVYFNLCFDDDGRLKFFGSPGYGMEFHDYRGFGKKLIARRLVDNPESGTTLVGQITILEDLSKTQGVAELFVPLREDEDRFEEVQVSAETMEKLTASSPSIVWPTVHSGNTHGKDAIYISVDTEGRVRETWPLNSDNGLVDDSARDQVRNWIVKPASDEAGKRVQVDGGLSFSFETRIEDPPAELSDAEVRQLATRIVEPVWPAGTVETGQVIVADVSVNEQGQLTGVAYQAAPSATGTVIALNDAIHQWTFRPLMRNGRAVNFHATVKFIVP
jgi:hypothetical protein